VRGHVPERLRSGGRDRFRRLSIRPADVQFDPAGSGPATMI
jgi:hypothetical protein